MARQGKEENSPTQVKVKQKANGETPNGTHLIVIPKPDWRSIAVPIRSLSALLMNRFGSRAHGGIEEGEKGGPKTRKRAPRNIPAEYEDALYQLSDGTLYFPGAAFAKAMVAACRGIDGLTMVEARQLFRVNDDAVKLTCSKPRMDARHVRVGRQKTTLRYRPIIDKWSAVLNISYNAGATTPEQIVNLVQQAGISVGVGELRPERVAGGSLGLFTVT